MEARAAVKFVRISPHKVRLVVDAIRDKPVSEALNIVTVSAKKAARLVKKVLESALANAENNYNFDVDRLWVSAAYVDGGRTLKRMKMQAMGRADLIRRQTSNITIVLTERRD
ncbi:50S ribosomal protein L22 [Candidatus Acetothermia bacterium]|jgi:large subunit ribosomal protein L22|nr:50S ribosomal protein L22 [Candidatus Acetothermia bacterium]MCI2427606.1 50S ribosomal protein L22 [Candidatus Acetothermia bacterium]MCI2428218.1 50S ribosomal protein L22 [Candidatus Acetothermia bacterium]